MINFKKKKRWHCLAGQQPTEMDLKIMEWERKGKLVRVNWSRPPSRSRASVWQARSIVAASTPWRK